MVGTPATSAPIRATQPTDGACRVDRVYRVLGSVVIPVSRTAIDRIDLKERPSTGTYSLAPIRRMPVRESVSRRAPQATRNEGWYWHVVDRTRWPRRSRAAL